MLDLYRSLIFFGTNNNKKLYSPIAFGKCNGQITYGEICTRQKKSQKKFTCQKKTQKMLEISSILENHQHKVFLTYFY